MSAEVYSISFRCYFRGPGNFNTHRQIMPLKDIPKWIAAYKFTHPEVQSITVKIWFEEERREQDADDQ